MITPTTLMVTAMFIDKYITCLHGDPGGIACLCGVAGCCHSSDDHRELEGDVGIRGGKP